MEGFKEGAKHCKNMMPYRPIYLWEITVNKFFTAITSSWDSNPWPANGRRAHRPARDRRAGHPRSGHTAMKVALGDFLWCLWTSP